MYVAPLRLMHQ